MASWCVVGFEVAVETSISDAAARVRNDPAASTSVTVLTVVLTTDGVKRSPPARVSFSLSW